MNIQVDYFVFLNSDPMVNQGKNKGLVFQAYLITICFKLHNIKHSKFTACRLWRALVEHGSWSI